MKEYSCYHLLALIFILSGCNAANGDPMLQLNADIAATDKHLIVKNGDAFVWKNGKIIINDSFVYQADIIPRGNSSIAFPLFMNEEGEVYKFLPLRMMKVQIHVPDVADGKPGVFQW